MKKLLTIVILFFVYLKAIDSKLDSQFQDSSRRNIFDEELTDKPRQFGNGRIKFGDSDTQPFSEQNGGEPTNFHSEESTKEESSFFGHKQESIDVQSSSPVRNIFGETIKDDGQTGFDSNAFNENPFGDSPFEDGKTPDGFVNTSAEKGKVAFKDDNIIGNYNQGPQKKRRKRRRRRPKNQRDTFPPGPESGVGPGYPPDYPGPPYNSGLYPGLYRPPHRPPVRPSIASEALTSVTNVLSSIAVYDDYRCVPRLLCEAAGGSLGASGVPQSVGGLQPLITLLSAYSGITTSPLFLFGQAVLLGMTSRGNPSPCRYAYPLCPTDPEDLVHYLNNHNGGFFRFFNGQPQNLQQFYQSLSGQNPLQHNLNPLQQNLNPFQQNLNPLPQNLNSYQQNLNPNQQNLYPHQQNYELYHQNPGISNQYANYNYDYQENQQITFKNPINVNNPVQQNYGTNLNGVQNHGNYGLLNPNYGNSNGGVYGKDYNNYNKYSLNNNKKIQKRIQNNPTKSEAYGLIENVKDQNSFEFPNDDKDYYNNVKIDRGHNKLRFPVDTNILPMYQTVRYPKRQHYNENNDFNIQPTILFDRLKNEYQNVNNNNNNHYGYYNNNGHYSYTNSYNHNDNSNIYGIFTSNGNGNINGNSGNNQEDTETLYIVRGNGDPNNPEIVKLRPGESIKSYSKF